MRSIIDPTREHPSAQPDHRSAQAEGLSDTRSAQRIEGVAGGGRRSGGYGLWIRRAIRLVAVLLAVGLILLPAAAEANSKKKKKKNRGKQPEIGWYQAKNWEGHCYNPPDFSEMGPGDRRMAWQETRQQLMEQWQGRRGDGISFDGTVITNLETALLAKPERIEAVAQENHKRCVASMKGKGPAEWDRWIRQLPGELTAGECPNAPFDYTLFDYLDIHVEWQIPARVCKDDKIRIRASVQDYFKTTEDGPWINVAGDPNKPATLEHPCTVEQCRDGQLLLRFTSENGVQSIRPVGLEAEFTAPEHGRIEVMINDHVFHDNTWQVVQGIQHRTSIEYQGLSKD